MISSLQLLASLHVALSRLVTGWPDATQGDDVITANLAGVDLTVWNDAYIAKLTVPGSSTVTVDLRNWTSLLFETGKSFSKAMLAAFQAALANPADTDAHVKVTPGATNGLLWFFTDVSKGIMLEAGDTHVHVPAATYTGFTVDATHKTLDFTNTGVDDMIVTVIIIGGT